MIPTIVICGFPGIGKSSLVENQSKYNNLCIEKDSSEFDERYFPKNSVEFIKDNIGKYGIVITSTHKELIEELQKQNIKFIVVYPNVTLKNDYIENYKKRGNKLDFIKLLDAKWSDWLDNIKNKEVSLSSDESNEPILTYELQRGQYLCDIVKELQTFKILFNYPKKEELTFAVDFDGTVVKDRFPEVGEDNPLAVETLNQLIEGGHKIILNTIRSNNEEKGEMFLDDAVNWYKEKGIELYGINENPKQKEFSSSPKVYANYYIDDKSFGSPVKMEKDEDDKEKPYVNWENVRNLLVENNII